MSWRLFITDTLEPDFDRLSDEEQATLGDELFRWVDAGPPRGGRRLVAGAEVFEDTVSPNLAVVYFVDEAEQYIAILRVRRR